MGSYAALSLAESDPRVRGIAIESVYDRPQEMLHILVALVCAASLAADRIPIRLQYLEREDRIPPRKAPHNYPYPYPTNRITTYPHRYAEPGRRAPRAGPELHGSRASFQLSWIQRW